MQMVLVMLLLLGDGMVDTADAIHAGGAGSQFKRW
jgi:hypothetical protein